MADFVRLVRGYRLVQTSSVTSGTEQFMRNDGATGGIAEASLPTIGSTALLNTAGSATPALARTKTTTYADGDINTPIIQYDYNTSIITTNSPGDSVDPDPNSRSFQLGAERVTLSQPANLWEWNEITGTPDVNQPLSKLTLVGEFTIPKGPLDQAATTTFLGVVIATAGRINSDTAWDAGIGSHFAAGQVLFMGITGGSAIDVDGTLQYQFNMHFSYRIINDDDVDGTPIAANDWQYLLAEDSAGSSKGWARPQTKSDGEFLYETATFSSLTS